MTALNETHDPKRKSWVASAEGHPDFPIQNLPLASSAAKRGTARWGRDWRRDPRSWGGCSGWIVSGAARWPPMLRRATLNPLMALGAEPRIALRKRLSELLSSDGSERKTVERLSRKLLHNAAECAPICQPPSANYTDFFAGIHHAVNASRRLGIGLAPNYKYFPIAYHGRASSVRRQARQSGGQNGQHVLEAGKPPSFGHVKMLDHEFEFGAWIRARQRLGEPVFYFARGKSHFWVLPINDWSARISRHGKWPRSDRFSQKTSPRQFHPGSLHRKRWRLPRRAIAPAKDDPQPLPYLWNDGDQQTGALDIELEASLLTPALAAKGKPAHRLSPQTREISIGPSRKWWRTTRVPAAI